MAYLLDANVFIEAKQRHYGFDFCPAYWDWLSQAHRAGRVYSIERVGDELAVWGDELSTWAKERGKAFFLPPDEQILPSLAKVAEWVEGRDYRQSAVNTFLDDADYYLVAHAHAHDFTVVTHEVPSDGFRRVKIPDACIGVGTKYITPFEMLRMEKARFVLGSGTETSRV